MSNLCREALRDIYLQFLTIGIALQRPDYYTFICLFFHPGLSYRLPDNDYSSCEVSKITDAPQLNDFVRGDDDTIEMVTPEQFFHSGGIQFYFNGIVSEIRHLI